MSFCIAVDGPAGAGKSTIAKRLAGELGIVYVDTGAMYRAMAYHMIQKGTDLEDQEAVSRDCQDAEISIVYDKGEQMVLLNGENVTPYLREESVSGKASVCSANPDVRRRLVTLQRKFAEHTDLVMDGRDIGTCVLPDAELKIYLTAGTHTRALRRYKELTRKGENCDLEQIERDIAERDYRDMHREFSPLKKAADAVEVDTSDMTIGQVEEAILSLVRERRGAASESRES
ncbi:MAG: (d)CMP kinase [Lachnospiraceae bacterium]|nr:(d)CMP kinase [Lachnospiraceae bacterium]